MRPTQAWIDAWRRELANEFGADTDALLLCDLALLGLKAQEAAPAKEGTCVCGHKKGSHDPECRQIGCRCEAFQPQPKEETCAVCKERIEPRQMMCMDCGVSLHDACVRAHDKDCPGPQPAPCKCGATGLKAAIHAARGACHPAARPLIGSASGLPTAQPQPKAPCPEPGCIRGQIPVFVGDGFKLVTPMWQPCPACNPAGAEGKGE